MSYLLLSGCGIVAQLSSVVMEAQLTVHAAIPAMLCI